MPKYINKITGEVVEAKIVQTPLGNEFIRYYNPEKSVLTPFGRMYHRYFSADTDWFHKNYEPLEEGGDDD